MMANKPKLSAALISNQTNIYYLTGFKGNSETEKEAYLLIIKPVSPIAFADHLPPIPPFRENGDSNNSANYEPKQHDDFLSQYFLFTSNLYLEQANQQIENLPPNRVNKNIRVIEISKNNPLSKHLAKILQKNQITTLGYEPTSLTVGEFYQLKKNLKNIKWRPIKPPIEESRQIKNTWEIGQIKNAANLTDKSFTFIVKKLKKGVTEAQIAWEIEKFIRENGGQLAFSPIVAFGKNSSMPHYLPSANCQLSAASLVLLDLGAKVNGYCSDMTRVVFFGKPSSHQQKVYKTVLSAQLKAIDNITQIAKNLSEHKSSFAPSTQVLKNKKDKIFGALLDKMTKHFISKQGFPPYQHSLGHGLGLQIHEQPRLTIKKDIQLKPGMVFTIEPAVYLPRDFGIRIEDTVLLTKSGLEILTKSTKRLIVI